MIKRYCKKCGTEQEVPIGLSATGRYRFCPNRECPRYDFLTVVTKKEQENDIKSRRKKGAK